MQKPKPADDARYMLRDPDEEPRKRGAKPKARIMRAFGSSTPVDAITIESVRDAFRHEVRGG